MNALFVGLVALIYLVLVSVVSRSIRKLGISKQVSAYRIRYVTRIVQISMFVFFVILALSVSGFEYSQITIFLSSVFAVLGVGLFAQWSILSNLTASMIIFFGFPYRVGDEIRVLDKDGDIAGFVEEITLFHVLIKQGDQLITYPNTLILQKAVIKISK